MSERITPSKGGKPDKLIRDALMIVLKREHIDAEGKKTSKINAIACKLVEQAIQGNTIAAKEVADRVDGRAKQDVEIEHSGEITFKSAIISQLDSFFAQPARPGLEDRSDENVVSN